MARPSPHYTTQQIREDQWIPFFDDFTRDNRGAHARLEVTGVDDVGYEVETEDRPFEGVSVDTKGGERTVWIVFGAQPQDHFTHGVHNVAAVRALPPQGGRGGVLEIEAKDGVKTILTLSWPEEYAIPPAQPRS